MSNQKLVKDQERLKHRNELETEVPKDLRDVIVEKLFDQLDEANIGIKITEMWNSANSDRGDWLDIQDKFMHDWDEFVNVEPQGVFESSSNLHIPMPLWVLRTYHARMMQAIISPEPSITVRSRKSGYVDKAPKIEALIKYTLDDWSNHYEGVEEAVDQWIWSWLSTGLGYLKWRWDVNYSQYMGVEDKIEEALPITHYDEETGESYQLPKLKSSQVEVKKVQKDFDGPVLEFINYEDVVVIGPDITDTRNADAVIHRQYLTADEMWTLVERGVLDRDAVEEVISGGEDRKGDSLTTNIKETRARLAHESSANKSSELCRYEILEAYIKYDTEKTGINSDVIVWVATNKKILLRATYLRRQNIAGERPIMNAIFHKRSGTNAGMPVGLAEMLHPISKELDAMHNMRVDFGLISTVPFGFYRTGSSVSPDIFQIEPGKLFPIDNPGDIYFPTISNRTVFGFQEEEALYKMVERLTGISDLALGVMSSTQGITRTAAGTNTLVGEMNVNLDLPLQRLNRGWKKALRYLVHMLQQRLPKETEVRITGDDGISNYLKLHGPESISGDYNIEVSPSSAASNKNVQVSQATQVLQIIQNPLLLQIGIVTPENVYESVKHYLKVIGIKNISRFINSKFEGIIRLTPQEEFDKIMAGEKVPVLPSSDNEGFMALGEAIFKDDDKLGMLSKEQTVILKAQMQQHGQMLQAMKQAAAQQANQNQQMLNQQLAAPQGVEVKQGQVNPNSQGDLPS